VTRRGHPMDELVDDFLLELNEAGADEDAALEALGALVSPVDPPADLRDRVLRSAAEGGRLHRFADRVAHVLDVTTERARALLDGVDDPTSFGDGPLPGLDLYHVAGGPAVQGAITGFIRLPPGSEFPTHEHLGREHVLIVQGFYRDDAGQLWGPGDEEVREKGTSHAFRVPEDSPSLVFLAVVFGGLRIGDEVFEPGDPRI